MTATSFDSQLIKEKEIELASLRDSMAASNAENNSLRQMMVKKNEAFERVLKELTDTKAILTSQSLTVEEYRRHVADMSEKNSALQNEMYEIKLVLLAENSKSSDLLAKLQKCEFETSASSAREEESFGRIQSLVAELACLRTEMAATTRQSGGISPVFPKALGAKPSRI